MRLFIACLFVTISAHLTAQYSAPLWTWKSYLPQKEGLHVAQSTNHVFYGNEGGILKIDKQDRHIQFFSKINRLNDIDIATIAYNQGSEKLIIAYKNGNIDILNEKGDTQNIPDLLINQTLVGQKAVNHILNVDQERILLACKFGVIEMNIKHLFTGFTTNMNLDVRDLAYRNGTIYAATEEGIYYVKDEPNVNLSFFGEWTLLSNNLPLLYDATTIEAFNDKLYAIIDNALYEIGADHSTKLLLTENDDAILSFLSSTNDEVIVGQIENTTGQVAFIDKQGIVSPFKNTCGNLIQGAIKDQYQQIWFSDIWRTIKIQDRADWTCSFLDTNRPLSKNCKSIRIKNSNVFVGSGGINENFGFNDDKSGFYVYIDRNWYNYGEYNIPIIAEKGMLNFLVAQPHPTENKLLAGAYPGGIVEIDLTTKETVIYDSENSEIKGPGVDPFSERVVDIKFDQDQNMWATCYLADRPLAVRTKNGEWYSYKFGNRFNLGAIEFDNYGNLWFQLGGVNGGVLVFNHNNTLDDTSDDRYFIFTQANSQIQTNEILCLKKDLEGDIWVGTSNGPVIFDCPDPFTNCLGSVRKVVEDSIPAILLQTEAISAIEVDGGNRKWFGTSNGIFVQSASGEEKIFRFTTSNSPLFSNKIYDITFDDKLGIMYVANGRGLQSFRIESTGGLEKTDPYEVIAFPNPVRPDFTGDVVIRNVARDANIKIVTGSGQLVYETQAVGGSAIWNVRNLQGEPVGTGVYHIMITSTHDRTNPTTASTKIMVIR